MSMVESGMYTGSVPPWVNLGTKVENAQSSKEAIKLAGLDWKVNPQPLFLDDGTEVEGVKANVRSSDNSVLGVVTNRYKIVQNEDAFAFTDMLLGEGVKYETAGSLSNGKRVWMLAKMDTADILGDKVEPYLVFTNSHDGKGAVKVAMTPIRVVCQNTLTLALSQATRTWSTKHSGDIAAKLDDARNTLSLAKKYMENLQKEADEMSQIVITHPMLMEYLNKMFLAKKGATERQKANLVRQRETFENIYNNKDDIKKFNGTGWGLINAVGDFIAHTSPMRMTSTYQENNFMNIVDGNSLMEQTCDFVRACA